MEDKTLQRPVIKDYGETLVGGASGTNTTSTTTLDLTSGNVFHYILAVATTTFVFSNPPASGTAGSFTLILKQDATGSRAITWPASVDWAGGTAPTATATASSVDIYTFVTVDGGTIWHGMRASADSK